MMIDAPWNVFEDQLNRSIGMVHVLRNHGGGGGVLKDAYAWKFLCFILITGGSINGKNMIT